MENICRFLHKHFGEYFRRRMKKVCFLSNNFRLNVLVQSGCALDYVFFSEFPYFSVNLYVCDTPFRSYADISTLLNNIKSFSYN